MISKIEMNGRCYDVEYAELRHDPPGSIESLCTSKRTGDVQRGIIDQLGVSLLAPSLSSAPYIESCRLVLIIRDEVVDVVCQLGKKERDAIRHNQQSVTATITGLTDSDRSNYAGQLLRKGYIAILPDMKSISAGVMVYPITQKDRDLIMSRQTTQDRKAEALPSDIKKSHQQHDDTNIAITHPLPLTTDLLTIKEAAVYACVTVRTISNWIKTMAGDKSPMLPGIVGKGRHTRIPRGSLDTYRKEKKVIRQTPKTPCKRTLRKPVKRKS